MAPRPQVQAQRIAAAMAATYMPLPFADAAAVSRAAQAMADSTRPG
jgi:magnesium chelatase subunit D